MGQHTAPRKASPRKRKPVRSDIDSVRRVPACADMRMIAQPGMPTEDIGSVIDNPADLSDMQPAKDHVLPRPGNIAICQPSASTGRF